MKRFLALLVVLSVFMTSCTTHIISKNPNADVYVNGVMRGKGEAKVWRTGIPKTLHLKAVENGQEVATLKLKRKFTIFTLVAAFYTYGAGLVLAWHFPRTVYLETEGYIKGAEGQGEVKKVSPWDQIEPQKSVWDKPPSEL